MALTPVAALMFRYNNPDALLVLLLTLGTYCAVRSLESGSWRWVTGAFVLLGTGFLTKELQAFLVAPAFAVAYLWFSPVPFLARGTATSPLPASAWSSRPVGGWRQSS